MTGIRETQVNREHKDRLFKLIFQRKEDLLELSEYFQSQSATARSVLFFKVV